MATRQERVTARKSEQPQGTSANWKMIAAIAAIIGFIVIMGLLGSRDQDTLKPQCYGVHCEVTE